MCKPLLAVIGATLLCTMAAWGQEPAAQEPKVKIDWNDGPTVGQLGDIAEIKIPEGFRFSGKEGAQKVLELTHNLTSGNELGVIVPDQGGWYLIFEFDDTGYVKDEEGSHLDGDAILQNIRENTERGNEERKKRGWRAFHVNGWQKPPYYDPQTHNLTWAILGKGDDPGDGGSVNHSIRILGRRGTMNVDLVVDPEEYLASKTQLDNLIGGFHYKPGSRYSDFARGDKVAEYGLTALIVGGAGAVALKTGLLAKLWKFIVMAVVALISFLKKIINAIRGKEEKIEDPNQQAATQGQ
jgi:uncharacterized membrane-anchored protein